MMKNHTYKGIIPWIELDVLRGLAALLMVVNHVGYKALYPSQIDGSLSGNLVFIGSFAPVIFFFVSGVGSGIQPRRKKASHWYVTLNKVVILFFADLLMRWSGEFAGT